MTTKNQTARKAEASSLGEVLPELTADERQRMEVAMEQTIARLIRLCERHGVPDAEVLLCLLLSCPHVSAGQLDWTDERLSAAAKVLEDNGFGLFTNQPLH